MCVASAAFPLFLSSFDPPRQTFLTMVAVGGGEEGKRKLRPFFPQRGDGKNKFPLPEQGRTFRVDSERDRHSQSKRRKKERVEGKKRK